MPKVRTDQLCRGLAAMPYQVLAGFSVTPLAAPGWWAQVGASLSWTAGIPTDALKFAVSNNDLLLVRNTGGTPATVTVRSAPDPLMERRGDILNASVAAGAVMIFGPFPRVGWEQSDSQIYVECSAAALEIAVVAVPEGRNG